MSVEITTPVLPIEEIARRVGVSQKRAAQLIEFAKKLAGKPGPKRVSKKSALVTSRVKNGAGKRTS
jgi:hypothetical protein